MKAPLAYPQLLLPGHQENLLVAGRIVSVPKCTLRLKEWTGKPVNETFGRKPLLQINGAPMFAELAVMNLFRADGWDARWVETYGKKEPIFLLEWKDDKYRNQVHIPFEHAKIRSLLADIAEANSTTYAGCWDVVAAKGDEILFAETKRHRKDSLRATQINWLNAGLSYGLQPNNFLIVEWDI